MKGFVPPNEGLFSLDEKGSIRGTPLLLVWFREI